MFEPQQHQLLDFGRGRKLERFGDFVLDRPAPAADRLRPANPPLWKTAHARYQRGRGDRGAWAGAAALPASWTIAHGSVRFELKATPFGHVGVFAEQAENWDWIAQRLQASSRPLNVLNLFAYTGGSTLAAAAAGAQVAHVDAARNLIAWARRNAELSQLAEAPIRWIAEDVRKFVRRELRRGNRYDAVILDPPTYGHGPRGQAWRIERDLPELLEACGELTGRSPQFLLLTCHSPNLKPAELAELVAPWCGGSGAPPPPADQLHLQTPDGRRLASGLVVRWPP